MNHRFYKNSILIAGFYENTFYKSYSNIFDLFIKNFLIIIHHYNVNS